MKRLAFVVLLLTLALAGSAAPLSGHGPADKVITERVMTLGWPAPAHLMFLFLAEVARAAGAPIGFEAVPEPPDGSPVLPPASMPPRSHRPIDLRGMTFGAALDKIVEFDPRYEWTDAGGIVNVRPRDASGDSTNKLNMAVLSFSVDRVDLADAATAIERLVDPAWQPPSLAWTMGYSKDPSPAAPPAASAGAKAAPPGSARTPEVASSGRTDLGPMPRLTPPGEIDWRERAVSVSVRDTTVAGVLNAVVRAHGDASWGVEYQGPAPSWPYGQLWFASLSVPQAVGGRTIWKNWPVFVETPVTGMRLQMAVLRLADAYPVRFGLELLPAPGPDLSGTVPGESWVDATGLPRATAVDRIVREAPGYEWLEHDGVVNILPRGTRANPEDPLKRRFDAFEATGATASDILGLLRRLHDGPDAPGPPDSPIQEDPPLSPRMRWSRREEIDRRVTLALRDVTLREILNRVVAAHHGLTWIVSYTGTRSVATMTIALRGQGWGYSTALPWR
jgi:hypothetical protein